MICQIFRHGNSATRHKRFFRLETSYSQVKSGRLYQMVVPARRERMDEGAIPLWEPVNQNPCAAWSMARASD